MAVSLLVVVALVLGGVVAVGIVLLVVALVLGVDASPPPSRAAQAARRHAALVHAAALGCLLAGLVIAPVLVLQLPASPAQGRLLGLVPAVAGLVFAAAHALGEATWPRPSGTVRRASLHRRTAGDVSPAWLRRVTWSWAALAVVTLVACGALGGADGRSVTRAVPDGVTSAGPFPGWYFGVPLLVAVGVVVAAAEGVLRQVARRPAVSDADPRWDGALRRLSAHRVLRGAQLVLAWTTAGVLTVAGAAVQNLGTSVTSGGAASPAGALPVVGLAMVLLGAAVALAGLVVAMVPGTPAGASLPAAGDPHPVAA